MLWPLFENRSDLIFPDGIGLHQHLTHLGAAKRPLWKHRASPLAFAALAPNDLAINYPLNMTVRMPGNITFTIRKRYETHHYFGSARNTSRKSNFATITAYDYSFAKLFADEGINVMLVGDSLGMTIRGTTPPACHRGNIAYHTRAVRRGAWLPAALDLPFMAYATPEQAFENAALS